jgi:large subunit ribosomal protein L43
MPPAQPLLRAALRSKPANGYSAFVPQIRKLVFEFCDKWPSSHNTRTFLLTRLQPLARANPHLELVVKQRTHKEPIVRGFYGAPFSFLSQITLIARPQSMTATKSSLSMASR